MSFFARLPAYTEITYFDGVETKTVTFDERYFKVVLVAKVYSTVKVTSLTDDKRTYINNVIMVKEI